MTTSVVKWSEVKLGEVQMGGSEVSTNVVKWSEGLSNMVSTIIRRYIYIICSLLLIQPFRLSHSVIFFWFHFVSLYIWLCVLCGSV